MSDMKAELATMLFGVAFLMVFITFVIVWPLVEYDCWGYSKATSRETKVKLMSCYVKHDGEWLTRKELRAVITAREGLK